MTTNVTKKRHTFKDIMKMFDDDKLPINYLWNNLTDVQRKTFIDGVHKNVKRHFYDGRILTKNQLNVLKRDMFIIQCKNDERVEYHSTGYAKYCCATCIVHNKRNKLMKCFNANAETGECCICIDTFDSGDMVAKLGCSHQFHKICIQKWLSKSMSCPCCRKNYESSVYD